MGRKSKVYVVQETTRKINGEWQRVHDLTPALAYGELSILVSKKRYMTINSQPIINEFKRKLQKFSDDDYLLLIGDPLLIGLATTIAAQMNRGRVNLLKWDRETTQYLMVPCDIYKK
jgi:hypothetical protein